MSVWPLTTAYSQRTQRTTLNRGTTITTTKKEEKKANVGMF